MRLVGEYVSWSAVRATGHRFPGTPGLSRAVPVSGIGRGHSSDPHVYVRPSLSLRTLGELPVLVPPTAEQESIGATLAALDAKIQTHTEIARVTRDYRSVLADALMTGVLPTEP
ncbi:hypothetical protein GCM10010340_24810 [Streptomyces griseoloalbus]|nr:hypothetical protein GCM10010340_24810 [Streptomyces albaduncus]